jgi:hypothetical protein
MFARCADDFTVLANQSLNEFLPARQFSGARVSAVLDRPEINYQGARQIGTGSSELGALLVPDDTNVLNYLQQVTTSEQGYLYVAADGMLVFKGRTEVLNVSPDAVFTSNGSGLPYQTLINEFGDELLYNYIVTESPATGRFETSDAASQALYQSQQYSLTNLLNFSASEVQALGQYLLGKYKDPVLRFTGLSNQLAALAPAHQNACLNLDLTDIASITKTFTAGTPASVTQTVIVSGISHNITPGSHIIAYSFESTDGNQYLTLDDAIFGVLDQNLLAF